MYGAIHPFPNTPPWRGAQLRKHRDNFTFTFIPPPTYPYIKGKGKGVPVLLTKYHDMKAYGGVEICSTRSLISALDGGEWSDSRPGRFTSRERAPGTHWIGG
jgi:hypothetical protein